MNKFNFNECGVCIDPNTPINYVDGINHYSVTTCEVADDTWVFGVSCHCYEQGFCYGGSINTPTTYETEGKAIHQALREIREYHERNIKLEQEYHPSSPFIKQAKKMVADIKKRLVNYMYIQPSLF